MQEIQIFQHFVTARRGVIAQEYIDSPAGHPLEACCEGSRGKGGTALDAKEAGMLKHSPLGKDLLTWPTLWD